MITSGSLYTGTRRGSRILLTGQRRGPVQTRSQKRGRRSPVVWETAAPADSAAPGKGIAAAAGHCLKTEVEARKGW